MAENTGLLWGFWGWEEFWCVGSVKYKIIYKWMYTIKPEYGRIIEDFEKNNRGL